MTVAGSEGRRPPSGGGARTPAGSRRARHEAPGEAGPAEPRPLEVDLDALSRFFGAAPAWSDPAAGRYRFRIDVPAGGWLELYVAPKERLVSLRVADGAVTSLHVDMTLDAVEAVGVLARGEGEPWLEVACGRETGGTPCTVSITLRPDVLVVLGYGRR